MKRWIKQGAGLLTGLLLAMMPLQAYMSVWAGEQPAQHQSPGIAGRGTPSVLTENRQENGGEKGAWPGSPSDLTDTAEGMPAETLADDIPVVPLRAENQVFFKLPELHVYVLRETRTSVEVTYERGPDAEHLEKMGKCPDSVVPGDLLPVDEYRLTRISLGEEDSSSRNSPYYERDFEPFRFAYEAQDDGKIRIVDEETDNVEVDYDPVSNVISLHLRPLEIALDEDRSVNSDCDRAGSHEAPNTFYGGPHYYRFVPPEDGRYTYYSFDNQSTDGAFVTLQGAIVDEYGQPVSAGKAYADNNADQGNFSVRDVYLEKGRTYYLGCMRSAAAPVKQGDYKIRITRVEEDTPDMTSRQEAYTTIHVKRGNARTGDAPITVQLSPAFGDKQELVLNSENGWEADFTGLPLYDENGAEIRYTVTEKKAGGADAVYHDLQETKRQNWWVMIDAPEDLRDGHKYLLALQDWGQAMYYHNPNTYYFLRESDENTEAAGLQRIENTQTVFVGPKADKGHREAGHPEYVTGEPALELGGRSYEEYLNPDSDAVNSIDDGKLWLYHEADGAKTLANVAEKRYLTLRGYNRSWFDHVYDFVLSNAKKGWHGDDNLNYDRALRFTEAGDGMAKISAAQQWGYPFGGLYEEERFMYLDLQAYSQTLGAADRADYAGQFKFFTPILKVEKTVTLNRPDTEFVREGYLDLHVKKEWSDRDKPHGTVTIRLSPAGSYVSRLTLSEENQWAGTFAGLPLYDAAGEEIHYTVTEDPVPGYQAKIGSPSELEKKDLWVMVDAPDKLEDGHQYLLAAQDWGQAMYMGNPNTYYFLKEPDQYDGAVGLHRIENTQTVFVGPKADRGHTAAGHPENATGKPALRLGGQIYEEYLNPDSPVTASVSDGEIWLYHHSDAGAELVNKENEKRMALQGNVWYPMRWHQFVTSNDEGWYPERNQNYSSRLQITPANDGMAFISSVMNWGGDWNTRQYLYLNLTAVSQTTGAAGEESSAGMFKFFKPVIQAAQNITITNQPDTPNTPPDIPHTPATPPDIPHTPATPPDIPHTPATPPDLPHQGGGGHGGHGGHGGGSHGENHTAEPTAEPVLISAKPMAAKTGDEAKTTAYVLLLTGAGILLAVRQLLRRENQK